MGWTDKVTHVTKSAAKTAAKTVAPIAQDAGREIGESLIIALERIAEKATDRLCEQVACRRIASLIALTKLVILPLEEVMRKHWRGAD